MKIGQKILIVEDDADLRESLAKLLEKRGFKVTQANNGDIGQFLSLLSNFSLLISDISMPEVDGVTMTKFIKSRINTPVIFITGKDREVAQKQAQDAKADALLFKPFEISELLHIIKTILG